MLRFFGLASLLVFVLTVPGPSAHAQYRYPAGYGGWGGWGGGGSTVQGSIASGMGNYAAGAGAYNVQTAQARSINANTAMQWNEYMYAVNKQNAATNLARRQKQQQNINESADATYQRLHDNPNPYDVHNGDALNVVLTELANPKVFTQFVQKSTQSIDSRLVKNINFEFAPQMILISLEDLGARGVPDVLATNPAFEADRQAIRAIVTKGKKEAESSSQVSIETLRSFREAVKVLKGKADSAYPLGTRQRDEADNYLKALYGLSKMLEEPQVEQFLEGLNRYPTTTMGHLVTFMQSFNLRFGTAKTPQQEAAYDQIYPLLVQLRDQSQGQGTNPLTAKAPLPDPKVATSFFSGMNYSDFKAQPAPHSGAVPKPPEPGPSR
ncbi:hypothetical protein V5E97_31465 [Singulisphaera sp. Ch08]|uniref:Uncharacterized protein n=1 Tax=Singulisphaera sp. Ch08 TaxID=3120278 RepID=A0AAU7CCC4_9BACT